ncbi:MAG: 7TM diverse intracellular signaling domain-containing protein, partial [Anaerolineales bacterium]
ENQATYYLRFQSGGSMTLPLTLWTQAAFLNYALVEQTFMGIFFGVLIGLLFYNLFLFFSLRELNYLFFVILLASLIFEESSYDGYLRIYLIPNLDIPIQYIEPVALPLLIGSMVLFADSFLELKGRLPKLHATSLVILAVWGALMLLIPFTSYRSLAGLMAPWSIISLSAVLIAGVASWRGGYRPSRFFLLAWLGLLISMIWIFLVRLGLASSSLLSENAFRMGYLWMAVCWSIALGDRINLLKAETEAANLELQKSEHRLSEILEGLPVGVVLYRKDQKPNYVNRRTVEILNNPAADIQVDVSAGRTLAEAIQYFSLKVAGRNQAYPLENLPIYQALHGKSASVDDIEVDQGDRLVPLEIWASPIRDNAGNVEAAVVVFQDITQRKLADAELVEYRKHLEALVEARTEELSAVNVQLQLRLDWLSAINLVNQIMARSADFTQLFDKTIEIINDLFGTYGSFIAELEDGKQQLKILAHACGSEPQSDLAGTVTTISESILSASKPDQHSPTYLSRDQIGSMDGPIGKHLQETNVEYIALIPLIIREQVFGVLGLEILSEERHITYEESDLLRIFSTDIAQLIEDERLYEQSKSLIVAEERNRLARDLHDSVTQTLFTASVLAETTPRIWQNDQELARLNMEKLSLLIRGALAEMRSLLLELRSGELHNQSLPQLLTTLAEAGRVRTRAEISLSVTGERTLPDNVTLTFYYIAQEGLNNAINHGKATQIDISLIEDPDSVELRILDDGRGFIPQEIPEGHLGINIMLERVAQIGADLRIISEPGEGAELILTWSDKVELEEYGRANSD